MAATSVAPTVAGYDRPGFTTKVVDGRLHVFPNGESSELSDKHITLIGAGPGGMTIKAPDRDCALAYLASVPGYAVKIEDGRVLVWRGNEPGEELSDKHVTRVGAGPLGSTVKAEDRETLDAYFTALGR